MKKYYKIEVLQRIHELQSNFSGPSELCELYSLGFLVKELSHYLLTQVGLDSFFWEFSGYTLTCQIPDRLIDEADKWIYKNSPVAIEVNFMGEVPV